MTERQLCQMYCILGASAAHAIHLTLAAFGGRGRVGAASNTQTQLGRARTARPISSGSPRGEEVVGAGMANKKRALFIRISPEDLEKIDRWVAEDGFTTRSAWIRHRLLNGGEESIPALPTNREWLVESSKLRFELAQVGNNLNQLVRLAHSRRLHTTRDFEAILPRLTRTVQDAKDRLEDWCRRLEGRD